VYPSLFQADDTYKGGFAYSGVIPIDLQDATIQIFIEIDYEVGDWVEPPGDFSTALHDTVKSLLSNRSLSEVKSRYWPDFWRDVQAGIWESGFKLSGPPDRFDIRTGQPGRAWLGTSSP